jgi:hypothetical protein
MTQFEIKRLASGGIITNYFCTSRCRHCLYNCSPLRGKGYLDPETGEEILRHVRRLGCASVHIGGGEPLLKPDKLEKILAISADAGVAVEYVETNASWFKDIESATAILSNLRRKGLRTLLVSISPFHNEFISFSRTKGVMAAARRAGMGVFPWIDDFAADLSRLDPDKTHSIEEFKQIFGDDYLSRVLARYWIHMGGRALNTFRPALSNRSPQQILQDNPGGCARELGDTTHFHVDLFSNYIPGLCTGLSISTEDLGSPLSEKKYPVITTLAHSGIRGIFEFAKITFGYAPKRNGYINKCDLCTEIRAFFVHHHFGGTSELNPREFYSDSG